MATKDLQDLQDYFDDEGILLPPIKSTAHPEGKRYTVPSPNFQTGLTLQSLASIAQRLANGLEVDPEEAKRLKFDDGEEEENFAKLVLGDCLDEMLADGVKWSPIRKAVNYAFTYFAMSPEAAERLTTPKARTAPPKPPKKRKK